MTTNLQRWIVRRSGFPFQLPGKMLGVVTATDKAAAARKAAEWFVGPITVEPERGDVNPELERAVDRAVKAAGRRERAGAYGRQQRRAKPLTIPDGDAS